MAALLPNVYYPARGGPSALDQRCTRCLAPEGWLCWDLRALFSFPRRTRLRPHPERRVRA